MSFTLRKINGDLYIDRETGRPEIVSGATKVDQELADLYLSTYDATRNWGSSLSLSQLSNTAMEQARSVMFLRLQQANDRIKAKQASDGYLTGDEKITEFSTAQVLIDVESQAIVFVSVAEVGDATVTKVIGQDYKPTSLMHVLAPQANIV